MVKIVHSNGVLDHDLPGTLVVRHQQVALTQLLDERRQILFSAVRHIFGLGPDGFRQALVFSFVSKLVHPIHINGGGRTSYIAFVTVGIAVAGFMAVGLARLVSAIQQEQSLGTLESLMVTPTTASVVLLGSVIYDLIYVPFRTVISLIIV